MSRAYGWRIDALTERVKELEDRIRQLESDLTAETDRADAWRIRGDALAKRIEQLEQNNPDRDYQIAIEERDMAQDNEFELMQHVTEIEDVLDQVRKRTRHEPARYDGDGDPGCYAGCLACAIDRVLKKETP